jgi:hypothetical protein
MLFIESICTDPVILRQNYELKLQNNGKHTQRWLARWCLPTTEPRRVDWTAQTIRA